MLERIDFSSKKMTKEEYKPVHDELVGKLVLLQQQARSAGVGLVVLVEGWSGAGKGSRISELVYLNALFFNNMRHFFTMLFMCIKSFFYVF